MLKKTKKAIALTATVTALGASLGVATEVSQAAEDKVETNGLIIQNGRSGENNSQTVGGDKPSVKIELSPQSKASNQKKTPAAGKISNQIKWEKPK
ncbi:hypothetical protein [Chlorobium ferrooxidans]|uniref:Uncharacterized protein n=1 Tax=Chlorobium ferrooxidans DSM 13031 TaxID=377431 RepID=Q0YTH7_9CHLB|nr:hypothetical protein [Chlorobium ferrooxidans]EAT59653.1 hypothetical protein CferDRAFT_1660 [Chlorobium ferrooxidans DSM 13031]